jgi:hypothetical protein
MKINEYTIKIGADPEFFVRKFGKLLSAHGLIPGSKERPYLVNKGAVQVDGMALEFNIDPAESYSQFEENMSTVFGEIQKMIPGYEIFVEPVADFGLDYIKAQPKEASDLGCSPDYNAYTKQANPRPDVNTPFRTASGHVHIGWTDEPVDISDEGHLEACRALTKTLDLYLGVPSLVWDTDDRRRSLYGAAGAFRPKPYGMEYRVLSNKWINTPHLRALVYGNTMEAIQATFLDPEIGDKMHYGLTAKQIISKTGAAAVEENGHTAWRKALHCLLKYGEIKSPRYYREVLEKGVVSTLPQKPQF